MQIDRMVGGAFSTILEMKDRLLTGLWFVLIVPFGSDLIRGLTIADFHPSWNSPAFSDRFMILVRVGMQWTTYTQNDKHFQELKQHIV